MLAGMMGTAGTPDTYLDYKRDLWVEWKVISEDDRVPKQLHAKHLPTPAQALWLNRRWQVGGNAVVLVGIKLRGRAYGLVLATPQDWDGPALLTDPRLTMRSASELAAYLLERVS